MDGIIGLGQMNFRATKMDYVKQIWGWRLGFKKRNYKADTRLKRDQR